MKRTDVLLLFALLFILAGAPSKVVAQSYPDTVIGIYDFYQRPPVDGNTNSALNPDPNDAKVFQGNLNWRQISAAFATAEQPELSNTPWLHLFYGVDRYTLHGVYLTGPAADDKMGDYGFVVKGLVGGSDGNYHLHVLLVDGTTRAVVGQTTVDFKSMDDAAGAGTRAAAQLGSIASAIQLYWKAQCAKDPSIAVQPVLTVTAPDSVSTSQAYPVHISGHDYDGRPLSGFSVLLVTSGGSESRTAATLDASGKAQLMVTAGFLPRLASTTADLVYLTPEGIHDEAMATRIVRVGEPDAWWEMHVHVVEDDAVSQDNDQTDSNGFTRTVEYGRETAKADLVYWFAQDPNSNAADTNFRSGPISELDGIGTYRHIDWQSGSRQAATGFSGSIDLARQITPLNISLLRGVYFEVKGGAVSIIGAGQRFHAPTDRQYQSFNTWDVTPTGELGTDTDFTFGQIDIVGTGHVTHAQTLAGRYAIKVDSVTPSDDASTGLHHVKTYHLDVVIDRLK